MIPGRISLRDILPITCLSRLKKEVLGRSACSMAKQGQMGSSISVASTDAVPLVRKQRGRIADRTARIVFAACAILLVLIIVSIFVFIAIQSSNFLTKDPHAGTLFRSSLWDPTGNYGDPQYGTLGLILGSIFTT